MKRLFSSARTLIGKFLRCAFLPNFKRSGEPFAQTYFSFGRTLADVFCNVGQIDKNHPWMRRTSRPRPVEVLGYVCSRTNWKKPFSLQTVMAGSITLMLIFGALSFTGMVATTTIGAGQAYATSMFTPPSPANDLALGYMAKSFGINITGVPTAAVGGILAGFQQMMALYSMAMLVLAGFILLYILIAAIANTAHEGRFGGSGFNQIWTPIRLIVAIGLLVPLPMVAGYNGYNSGQYVVMKVSEWGSGLATNLWIPFATALALQGDVIATPNVPAAGGAVAGVLYSEFCMVRYNQYKSDIGIDDPAIIDKPQVVGEKHFIYYTTDSDTSNNYCGIVEYTKVVSSPATMASKISAGYETAFNQMRSDVIVLAKKLNDEQYISPTSGTPGTGTTENIKTLLASDFILIVDKYQKNLVSAIASTTTGDQAAAAGAAMTTAIKETGWAGAGSWFNTIARLNAEVMSASRGLPVSQMPQLSNALNSVATSDASATSALSKMVEKGLLVLKSNLNNVAPTMSTPTTGAGNVGGVFTKSVTVGLDQDTGWLSAILSGASNFVGFVLAKILAPLIGGPFAEIGLGADANLSETNPLGQLAAIGNWLINVSLGCLVTAVAIAFGAGKIDAGEAVLPITIMLMALTSLTFSAGVLLFYVTPLVPFIRFTFGVIGWLLNILEAVIAIPLVAVAHLNTKGDGVMGGAQHAYMMVLSIFLRPALLIVGIVIALMMFTVSIGILNDLYKNAVIGTGSNATGGLSILVYTLIYCAIAYGMCNLTFKLIEEIPNRALTWIGQTAAKEITQDEGVVKSVTHAGSTGFIGMARDGASKIPAPKPIKK